MAKLRTLLVDDEGLSLDLLEASLDGHPSIEVVARSQSGEGALSRLREAPVDLMFLDIDMPGLDGLSVAARADPVPMIVFATAHASYALDAFEADAVDYLLKPFERERVLAAVDKACVQARYRLGGREAWAALPVLATPRQTLPVRDGGRTTLVRVADIVWAEGAGDYALLHTGQGTHTARVTLKDLERDLEQSGFLRVHRSVIVCIARVTAVAPLPKGEAILTMTDGSELKASRTYRAAIERLTA